MYAAAVWLLHADGGIGVPDSLALTGWLIWAHTVPGTLVWRLVDRDRTGPRRRPFAEDVVLGTIVGIVLGTAAYLAAVVVGVPQLVVGWPLLVLMPALTTPGGRALVRVRQPSPTPRWWSWSLALAVLFVVVYSDRTLWVTSPLAHGVQAPYVDEPFHIALAAEFRHHFPPQAPFVAGTPLKYHWLFYPFAAAASWGTGIELLPLIHLLLPALLTGVLVLGIAVAAARLAGHRWAAPAAVLLISCVKPLHLAGWRPADSPAFSVAWLVYKSPTQMIANALCPLLVVLLARMLEEGSLRGPRRRHWIAVFMARLAVAGAKSAMLPLFIAGLAGTCVVLLVVRGRVPWLPVALTAVAVVVFGLAIVIFYGSGSRALSFAPLQFANREAAQLGLVPPDGTAPPHVRLAIAVSFLACLVPSAAATLGAWVGGGWRRPTPWLLLGAWVAGVGVYLLWGHPSLSQAYFWQSAVVPVTVLAAVGWARLIGTPTWRRALGVGGLLAAGLGWAFLVRAVVPSSAPSADRPVGSALTAFLPAIAVALGGVVVAAIAVLLVGQRHARRLERPSSRRRTLFSTALATAVSLMIGMCLLAPAARAWDWHETARRPHWTVTMPTAGLAAARWLRAHSSPDDLVATNMHTRQPWSAPTNHRQFWLSAFAERRVLVEGWAYIPPESVGLPSNARTNASGGAPFWRPRLLRLNDQLFRHATPAIANTIRRRYGVRWLFADRRRQVDLGLLRRVATVAHHDGRFWVLRLRPPRGAGGVS